MKKSLYAAFCLAGYGLFALVLSIYTGRQSTVFFVWNLFLAFLPLLFSDLLLLKLKSKNRITTLSVFLFFLWLIFFPNAPYMITDMIYFGDTSYFADGQYTTSLLAWGKLIYLGVGISAASYAGMESLFDVHQAFLSRKGRVPGSAALIVISLLSGYAIYAGRILRLNSWDVLHPLSLAERLTADLSTFSVRFSLLFSGFVLVSYLAFLLTKRGNVKRPGS